MRWSGLPGSLAAKRAAKRAERGWVSWAARVGLRRGEGVGLLASGPGEGREEWAGRSWSWAGLGFPKGWFLVLGFSSISPFLFLFQTNTQLGEFKFKFEFTTSTQTIKLMHQHECNNKILNLNKF